MSGKDWDDQHWVDEDPEVVECGWCGFAPCACDEIEDVHDFEQEMIYGDTE